MEPDQFHCLPCNLIVSRHRAGVTRRPLRTLTTVATQRFSFWTFWCPAGAVFAPIVAANGHAAAVWRACDEAKWVRHPLSGTVGQ
eukprot:3641093-Prymnesium_polylepis.1